MAEITQAGYQSIRGFIEANWNHIELQDDKGQQVIRLDTTDPRVSFTHQPGAESLELSIVVTGSDDEITLPQKFAGSAVFTSAVATDSVTPSEPFSPFEMITEEDQITVRHRIQVPQTV